MSVHGAGNRWTDEMTDKFILLYKEHPALWDSCHPEYKARLSRMRALQKIVDAMNIEGFNIPLAKLKIKNIRSHYCQELKKIHYSESIREERHRYKPSLIWFPIIDSFLREHVQQSFKEGGDAKSTYDLINDQEIKAETVDLPGDLDQYLAMQQSPIRVKDHANPDDEDRPNKATRRPRRRFRRIRWTRESAVAESEFDVFCRSVAIQMNKMPLGNALNLQMNILKAVTQVRMNSVKKK